MKYLLYPATDDQSISFYQRQTESMQDNIIASSCLSPDTDRVEVYKNYVQLPNVFEETFLEKVSTLVKQKDIKAIFCKDDFVADEFIRILPNVPVVMIGEGLISLPNRYYVFEKDATNFIRQFENRYARKPIITSSQITEILYSVSCLFGQSYTSKVLHFVEILEHCPREGLMVEAGALMGKQSVALALLQWVYKYKEFLIVDPWGKSQVPQKEDCVATSRHNKLLKWEYIKKICETHINNHRTQNVNIIQNTIEEEIKNINNISFIYLDGNHDYKAVVAQLDLLKDKMLSGGCILCDDYLWPVSDSVKRAVDEFIEKHKNIIKETKLMDENLAIYFK